MSLQFVPGRMPGAPRAHAAAERERTQGHGHGMGRNRTPKTERGLPHDGDRGEKQPYASEVEDYSGGGVVHPPEEQTGRRDERPQKIECLREEDSAAPVPCGRKPPRRCSARALHKPGSCLSASNLGIVKTWQASPSSDRRERFLTRRLRRPRSTGLSSRAARFGWTRSPMQVKSTHVVAGFLQRSTRSTRV
jgi:hypothetical protein